MKYVLSFNGFLAMMIVSASRPGGGDCNLVADTLRCEGRQSRTIWNGGFSHSIEVRGATVDVSQLARYLPESHITSYSVVEHDGFWFEDGCDCLPTSWPAGM
jgi:hypothetical protein